MTKILSGDPGKIRDSFFMVGTEVKNGKIYVRLAKRRLGKSYLSVCEEFANLSHKHNFDYNVIEYNNTGVAVVEMLTEQFNLPVIPITTINMGREMKKKVSPKNMDKYEVVHRFISRKENHQIIFPPDSKCSEDMLELKRQVAIFAEHRTEAGNVQYYAPGSEHDDGIMALLINFNLAERFLDGDKRKDSVIVASKKAEYRDRDDDEFGSGAPEGATVHSRYVING